MNCWNRLLVAETWGEQAVLEGYRPQRIALFGEPERLPAGLVAHLRSFGNGVFAI